MKIMGGRAEALFREGLAKNGWNIEKGVRVERKYQQPQNPLTDAWALSGADADPSPRAQTWSGASPGSDPPGTRSTIRSSTKCRCAGASNRITPLLARPPFPSTPPAHERELACARARAHVGTVRAGRCCTREVGPR